MAKAGSMLKLSALILSTLAIMAFSPISLAAGFLHTQGEDIVDESGQKVMLRGVGLGNWMLPEGYMWRFGNEGDRPRKIEKIVSDLIGPDNAAQFWKEYRSQYITQNDIKRISELGFNSVRPSLDARLFLTEGDNPVYVNEGFDLLDNLIKWSKDAGVYVIIDMHAAPGGQTGANIDDSAKDQPELFMDPKYQDRVINLWIKIATRYKDEPTVAAYDLLNEPLPERTGAAAKYKKQLEPLYKRITQAIRTIDKKHMLTVEGANWANDWSVFSSRFDDNLVYQFHYYCWNNPTQLKDISQYLDDRKRLGAPIWAGETGERDNAIYWGTTDYFESNNIGWSFWPWKKMDTINTPYSIKSPKNWDAIAAYSQPGVTEKPSREIAQAAFDELLQNIRLENCTFYPDVINALFRQLPGKVEAENYGHKGLNESYFVRTDEKAKFYRKSEPVPIESILGQRRRRGSGQAIQLSAGEWTAYEINSFESKTYTAMIKVKVDKTPATINVMVNGNSQKADLTDSGWLEVKLNPISFDKGVNQLKLSVEAGSVSIDWISFE